MTTSRYLTALASLLISGVLVLTLIFAFTRSFEGLAETASSPRATTTPPTHGEADTNPKSPLSPGSLHLEDGDIAILTAKAGVPTVVIKKGSRLTLSLKNKIVIIDPDRGKVWQRTRHRPPRKPAQVEREASRS